MAHTALDEKDLEEFFDDDQTVAKHVQELATQIRKANGNFVVYTGAGVSTSCGISDFRGPNGIWTRQNQIKKGKAAPGPVSARVNQSPDGELIPSPTHMALVALQNAGLLAQLISTNCDGLHIKSGILPQNIVELHGNCYIEACASCGKCYYRSYPVDQDGFDRSRAIVTGRKCDICGDLLRRTDVAFGQSLPDKALQRALKYSKNAAVVLTLGTSLRVEPACSLPYKNKRAVSCVVNLQKTPYDRQTSIRVFCPTDIFMAKLLEELNLSVVPYSKQEFNHEDFDKYYSFRSPRDESWFARSEDEDALNFLRHQQKGMGIKMATDASGKMKVERYSVEDNAEEDFEGFEIYPKKDCPHLHHINWSQVVHVSKEQVVNGCEVCKEPEENWLCLSCNSLLCGRMKNQHMMQHTENTEEGRHVVCASLMDLSFWCYACNSYVTSPLLTPVFNRLHEIKFGESALPIHDIM